MEDAHHASPSQSNESGNNGIDHEDNSNEDLDQIQEAPGKPRQTNSERPDEDEDDDPGKPTKEASHERDNNKNKLDESTSDNPEKLEGDLQEINKKLKPIDNPTDGNEDFTSDKNEKGELHNDLDSEVHPQCVITELEETSTVELPCRDINTDCNNNYISRAETPDNDLRGISPEIFCMTHMSPTELYGKDHMIGAPRLLTRPQSSLSRSESRLNTPDPLFVDDDEPNETILYYHNKGLKRRISEVDENENPVNFSNFYNVNQQYISQAIPSFTSSQSFLPENIARPMPIAPETTTYPSYGYSQLDLNCNPCSPVQFSEYSYDTGFRNPSSCFLSQAASCSSYSASLRVPQGSRQSSYTNTSQVFSNISADIGNSTPVVFRRPEQTMENLNSTDFYRSTHQTEQNVNMNKSLSASTYCQVDRSRMNLERSQVREDSVSNNMYEENLNIPMTGFHRINSEIVTHETNNVKGHSEGNIERDSDYRCAVSASIAEDNSEESDMLTPTECEDATCKYAKTAESVKDRLDVAGESTDTMRSASDSVISWKTRNATVPVALKAKDKKVFVSVSDLGGKTVKQLMQIAEEKERVSSSQQENKVVYNEAFIEKFKEERKTKSPMSAFCAALDSPKKPEKRQVIAAQPRIPVPALLMPNEVPMMYSGQMLVPYFQTSPLASSTTGMMASGAHGTSELMNNQPVSQCTETTQLGMFGSYTLTSRTAVSLSSRIPMTPLTLSRQLPQASPYTTRQCPVATSPVMGHVPIAPLTVAGQKGQTPPAFSMRIAPTATQPKPILPTYPTDIGQIPMIPPTVATPLYEKLPDPYTSTCTRTLQSSSVPPCSQPRFLPTSAPKRGSGGATTGMHTGSMTEKLKTVGSSSSTTAFHRVPARSSTPVQGTRQVQGASSTPVQGTRPVQGASSTTVQGTRPVQGASSSDQKCLVQTKCWKAKHYSFTILRIGTYMYTCDLNCHDKAARLKLLFSKRRLVYEYQVDSKDTCLESKKTMAEVVINFENIVGMCLNQREMKLEVNAAPMMHSGVRGMEKNLSGAHQSTVYNRKEKVDLTGGQLELSPYHHLQFKTTCTSKIREDLEQFDPRFEDMLRRSFVQQPGKTLCNSSTSEYLVEPNLGSICDCMEGCNSTSLCPCCAVGVRCTLGGCSCLACKNPLNILQNMGLPSDKATKDPCLMDNIYQINNLDDYVKTPLTLDCCEGSTLLFSCIPGEVPCPNPACGARYKFSWCSAHLCNEELSPRNHCEKCRRCTDYRDLHCQTCNMCYFAGEHGSFKCAACHSFDDLYESSSTDSG